MKGESKKWCWPTREDGYLGDLKWLKNEYGCDVIGFTADVGRPRIKSLEESQAQLEPVRFTSRLREELSGIMYLLL